jgi:hypothetical protein
MLQQRELRDKKGNRRTRTREGENFGIRKETEEREQEKKQIDEKNNEN